MDKNAIQKYAVWARRELLERVTQKAYQYGVREDGIADVTDSIDGRLLSRTELDQRRDLVSQVEDKGFAQVMEEVAYTWFNRFCALRFMEVNQYLPVRVFSDEENQFKPQIITEALQLEMKSLDMAKVYEYVENNQKEALFKLLLIAQCNELNKPLPCMFQSIDNYTELLFPDNLLREGSVAEQLVSVIPHDDWKDAVQIIGWLYQYYNTEPKAAVFANLKKNVKISKENIPAATQLFTPDWIVRYMVENSLGRIAVDKLGLDPVAMEWKYYLPEAEQTPEVTEQLKVLSDSENFQLEELKVIDPCMGSGHILVYAFDVLMQIYQSQSYTPRNAAALILSQNLYGLDIDLRAYQMAYFAVMMKARSFDRRFFDRGIAPQLFCPTGYSDGEEFGSLLNVDELEPMPEEPEELTLFNQNHDVQMNRWNFRRLLAQKYDVVVTNPPYMGGSGMSGKLSDFVKKEYPDSKSDMFSCFIERGNEMAKPHGYNAMVTMQSWMFLSSFEKMRQKIIRTKTISNLLHMENMVMGIAFGTAVAIIKNVRIVGYKGTYNHITMKDIGDNGEPSTFPVMTNRFAQVSTENFSKIPGSPIAYWVSEGIYQIFNKDSVGEHFDIKAGICTGENANFIMQWSEIDFTKSSICQQINYQYTPHNKGGEYRKWYGNREFILKYSPASLKKMELNPGFRHDGQDFYFKPHIGWSKITSAKSSFRLYEHGFTFDSAGLGMFTKEHDNYHITLALLNSKIDEKLILLLNPTLNVTPIVVKKLPYLSKDIDIGAQIDIIVNQNITISRTDWDSFETSWDFQRHPLV